MITKKDSIFKGWVLWLGLPILIMASYLFYCYLASLQPEPEMVLLRSKHFSLHYEKGSLPEDSLAEIGTKLDAIYRFVCETFGYDPDELASMGLNIKTYLALGIEDMERRAWFNGYGPIHFVDSDHPDIDVRSTVELVLYARIGGATPLLYEGAVTLLALQAEGQGPHGRAAAILHEIPNRRDVVNLVNAAVFDEDFAVNTFIAASFLGYLVERHGWIRFIQWYRQVTRFEHIAFSVFEEVYGYPLNQAANDWIAYLESVEADTVNAAEFLAAVRLDEQVGRRIQTQSRWRYHDRILRGFSQGHAALVRFEPDQALAAHRQVEKLLNRSVFMSRLISRTIVLAPLVLGLGLFAGFQVSKSRRKKARKSG